MKELTKDDVWGDMDNKGMRVAQGYGPVNEYFTQETKDALIAVVPEICPVFGDKLGYKSVTVVCQPEELLQVMEWLVYVHGAGCVSQWAKLPDGRTALRSNYQCW